MSRPISDTGGFTNEGLEIESDINNVAPAPESVESGQKVEENKIQISRPHYDQEKFHDLFDYSKPERDSGECFGLRIR